MKKASFKYVLFSLKGKITLCSLSDKISITPQMQRLLEMFIVTFLCRICSGSDGIISSSSSIFCFPNKIERHSTVPSSENRRCFLGVMSSLACLLLSLLNAIVGEERCFFFKLQAV